jgi:hypothetical protein
MIVRRGIWNMNSQVSDIRWERYPTLVNSPQAQTWLKIQRDLGLAQNTVDQGFRPLAVCAELDRDKRAMLY